MIKGNIKKKLEMIGWAAFTIGSLVFAYDSLTQGNYIGLIGSIVFFIGCLFFLISERY